MMSLKSMERGYCCLTELETKGLFSTCSKFIMYVGGSIAKNYLLFTDFFLTYRTMGKLL
jgi:hypothetical protein